MHSLSLPLTLVLAPGEYLHWPAGEAELQVVDGLAWFTRPGDPLDHFLRAGDRRTLEAGALVGAESELRLRLATAVAAATPAAPRAAASPAPGRHVPAGEKLRMA